MPRWLPLAASQRGGPSRSPTVKYESVSVQLYFLALSSDGSFIVRLRPVADQHVKAAAHRAERLSASRGNSHLKQFSAVKPRGAVGWQSRMAYKAGVALAIGVLGHRRVSALRYCRRPISILARVLGSRDESVHAHPLVVISPIAMRSQEDASGRYIATQPVARRHRPRIVADTGLSTAHQSPSSSTGRYAGAGVSQHG